MRMWEIREGYGRKDEIEEAYMEGCEEGYRKAMEEMGHRGGSYGNRTGYGQRGGSYSNRMGMREDYDDMGERRMRDSRGRFM